VSETSTQFVARVLGLIPYPPAKPSAASLSGDRCWLCGGELGDEPWAQDESILVTFTNPNQARDPYEESLDVRTTTRVIVRAGLREMSLDAMRQRDPTAMHKLMNLYPDGSE